ncbi:hypothetical protein C810_05161 [Lachnospiraceae bacterium A2]|nr:hypothetical protein C810_05161 [Lachnospiraceae bacterium A2]
MFERIPDNYDEFEKHEAEMERTRKMRNRLAHAYEQGEREDRENDIPFNIVGF